MSVKKSYLFYCPNFDHASGGIRALQILCRDLCGCGYDARITSFLPGYTPGGAWITGVKEIVEFAKSGAVAVYPEGVIGNPFKCQKVARLLLAPTQIRHPKEEIKFVYTKALWSQCGTYPVLYIPTIEPWLFYAPKIEERHENFNLFYVGKSFMDSKKISLMSIFEHWVEITRWPNWPKTRLELADILRQGKILLCFDNLTILAHEAALCGCVTVIVPDGRRTYESFLSDELGTAGIAFGYPDGTDEWRTKLFKARETLPLAQDNYQRVVDKYRNEYLPRFIELTQK